MVGWAREGGEELWRLVVGNGEVDWLLGGNVRGRREGIGECCVRAHGLHLAGTEFLFGHPSLVWVSGVCCGCRRVAGVLEGSM